MYKEIDRCRICENPHLEVVLDLGEQVLTGVFPRKTDQQITSGPLRLVKCHGPDSCGLVQLQHSYSLDEMYGENYGYRSGLNASMVAHLKQKVASILQIAQLTANSIVVDIGSNDGTTLGAYPRNGFRLLGIDPTAAKFRQYYEPHIEVLCDFYSEQNYRTVMGSSQADVVTSFSMFYDLERPLDFVREIERILSPNGIWVFEQSYMPTMLERNSYDTVCHEHLEYYTMRQIQWMLDAVGLKAIDVQFNDVNGGSFSVTAARKSHPLPESPLVRKSIERELELGLNELPAYAAFAARVAETRSAMRNFLDEARRHNKKVGVLGASTKGNVLLQYCNITTGDVVGIGEVNPDKFGAHSPGTLLPIIEERALLAQNLDYLIVLPWHFRDTFLAKKLPTGTRLVFPLPNLEVV